MVVSPERFDELRLYAFGCIRDLYLPGGDRDDLEQEAMIGMVQALRDYKPELGRLETFVGLCARRQAITAVKVATRGKHLLLTGALRELPNEEGDLIEALEFAADPRADVEKLAELREEIARLRRGMGTLSETERRAIVGRMNGLSYAETEGLPAGAKVKVVDNAIQRAEKKLRRAA